MRDFVALCAALLLPLVLCSSLCSAGTGGWRSLPLDDQRIGPLAEFAVREFNANLTLNHNATADGSMFALVAVVSAKMQVVAGLKFKITVDLQRDGITGRHVFTVWDRFGELRLVDHGLVAPVGGFTPVPVDDEGVELVASFAVSEINKRSNSLLKYQLLKIVSASRQVVAGLNYRLEIEIALPGQISEIHVVTVWDRFGDLRLTDHHIQH